MGSAFAAILDAIASLIHLKLKYHNFPREPTIINADLKGTKIIYQALQRDQGDGVAMEINVASLTGEL